MSRRSSTLSAPAVLKVRSARFSPNAELRATIQEHLERCGGQPTFEFFEGIFEVVNPEDRSKVCFYVLVYTDLRPGDNWDGLVVASWMVSVLGMSETRDVSTQAGNTRLALNGGIPPYRRTH